MINTTTEQMTSTYSEPQVPAGWHVDPDDPHVLRWWDGAQWGEAVKPRLVLAAEDHTRIFNEQTRLLAQIRNDVASIKSIVVFWAFLTVIGLIGYILVINTSK